jgi:hypothetical protein
LGFVGSAAVSVPAFVLAALTTACTSFGTEPAPAEPTDAGADAPVIDTRDAGDAGAPCRLDAPFDMPTLVPGLDGVDAFGPRLSADELECYFQTPSTGRVHIAVARRDRATGPFGAPTDLVGPLVSSTANDGNPMLSVDGLSLYFTSNRLAPTGFDLFVATRPTPTAVFGAAARIDAVSTAVDDSEPYLSADGLELFFARNVTPGKSEILRSVRSAGAFGAPEAVSELNTPDDETLPVISLDKLTIYLGSNRGGAAVADIYKATRPKASGPFSTPTIVSELVSTTEQRPSWISPDGCRLYYSRGHNPSRMYVASKAR